ncbi:hypothetical protein [Psychromonas ingrahamii]|uniref:hypothetical protein n=1 Tax=Psychromonas ingrahamii TaxID=357794 RepID=UPI0012EE6860|nr:hypothetical protein [Psychromonas ingrahamii]
MSLCVRSLIEISIDDVTDQFDRYIEFKELLYDENEKLFSAKGLFINNAIIPV